MPHNTHNMNHNYLDEITVLDALGGYSKVTPKRPYIYTLNNSKKIWIRYNAESSKVPDRYWYNFQLNMLNADIDYYVCVVGMYGFLCIPFYLIKDNILAGKFSVTKNTKQYKIVIKVINNNYFLFFTNGAKNPPLNIQIYFYDCNFSHANEINHNQLNYYEGNKKQVFVNAFERNPQARRECIQRYGAICQICGFDFAETYGIEYKGFIEVHHIVPISQIGTEYHINPIKDLIPVCSNCHSALHKKINGKEPTIEELKQRLKQKKEE